MLDISHLTKLTPGNVDYFYNTGGTTSWQTWEKPRGIIMLEIICIGAGGGGRSGWCANSATRSGGGGGGSGGFSRLLIPAVFLPDVLYVTVGRGGAGGGTTTISGTANTGSDGSFSSVNIAPTNAAFYIVCYANAGAGAVTGNSTTGTAGVGAGVAVQTTALMSNLGIFTALAGQNGGAGANSAGTALAYPTTGLLLSGGGAGGGSTSVGSGGDITAPTQTSFSLITTRTGGTTAATGNPGVDGLSISQPLMSIGGAGGGSSTSITSGRGGNGGNGGFGCGGGGGGSGPTNTGSGVGGNGGDGLVIIRSW